MPKSRWQHIITFADVSGNPCGEEAAVLFHLSWCIIFYTYYTTLYINGAEFFAKRIMLSYRCIRACPIGFHSISTIIFTNIIHFNQFHNSFFVVGEFVAELTRSNTIYMHCRGICINISQNLLVRRGSTERDNWKSV